MIIKLLGKKQSILNNPFRLLYLLIHKILRFTTPLKWKNICSRYKPLLYRLLCKRNPKSNPMPIWKLMYNPVTYHWDSYLQLIIIGVPTHINYCWLKNMRHIIKRFTSSLSFCYLQFVPVWSEAVANTNLYNSLT